MNKLNTFGGWTFSGEILVDDTKNITKSVNELKHTCCDLTMYWNSDMFCDILAYCGSDIENIFNTFMTDIEKVYTKYNNTIKTFEDDELATDGNIEVELLSDMVDKLTSLVDIMQTPELLNMTSEQKQQICEMNQKTIDLIKNNPYFSYMKDSNDD